MNIRKEKLNELKSLVNQLSVVDIKKISPKSRFIRAFETVFKTPREDFISLESYDVTLADGTVFRKRMKIVKNKGASSASIILPIDEKTGEVILTIQPRFWKLNDNGVAGILDGIDVSGIGIELPAGYRDKDKDGKYTESQMDAAIRELAEETGYQATSIKELGGYYQDQGCTDAYNSCYQMNCKKVSSQKLDSDEKIKLFLCEYEELLYLMEKGFINDAGSIITIEKYEKAKSLVLKK